MKKIYLFLCSAIISSVAFCQTIDSSKNEQYCQLIAYAKALSNKVTIEVDYGQQTKFFKDNRIKDENGNIQKFNSTIDALNYMGTQGWKLVSSYAVVGGTLIYYYIMRRPADVAMVDQK